MRMPEIIELDHPVAAALTLATSSPDFETEILTHSRSVSDLAMGLLELPASYAPRLLKQYERTVAEQTEAPYFVRDIGGVALGFVELRGHVQDYAELQYGIGPHARRKGIASAATIALLQTGKERWGLERVSLRISTANEPSRRLAQSLGAVKSELRDEVHVIEGHTIVEQSWWLNVSTMRATR